MLYFIATTVESDFLSFLSMRTRVFQFARVPKSNDNGLTVSGDDYDFVGDVQLVSAYHRLLSTDSLTCCQNRSSHYALSTLLSTLPTLHISICLDSP